MFEVSWNKKDLVRAVWSFIGSFVIMFAATASGIVKDFISSCQTHCDVAAAKSAGIAALVALGVGIFTAIKNLLLKDGTLVKG